VKMRMPDLPATKPLPVNVLAIPPFVRGRAASLCICSDELRATAAWGEYLREIIVELEAREIEK
jgi:hypothetical protein